MGRKTGAQEAWLLFVLALVAGSLALLGLGLHASR